MDFWESFNSFWADMRKSWNQLALFQVINGVKRKPVKRFPVFKPCAYAPRRELIRKVNQTSRTCHRANRVRKLKFMKG